MPVPQIADDEIMLKGASLSHVHDIVTKLTMRCSFLLR